jgi:diaminopimelate dehydrogenase
MVKRRLAVIGFGKVGRACCETILAADDLALAGVVRRPASLGQPLPSTLGDARSVAHVSELEAPDGALVCVPVEHVAEAARIALQHRIPIVECALLHGQQFEANKEAIGRDARRHKVPAIVGAGWDPGGASILRGLFTLLAPRGHTRITHRPGVSLRHLVPRVPGLVNALYTEVRTAGGAMQRYVYVELEPGADADRVEAAIRSDPLFLAEETLVFPVESVATLEEEGHGVVIERRGSAGRAGHQHLLVEARFDLASVTGEIMVAAARALPRLKPGSRSLFEVPLDFLWSEPGRRALLESI